MNTYKTLAAIALAYFTLNSANAQEPKLEQSNNSGLVELVAEVNTGSTDDTEVLKHTTVFELYQISKGKSKVYQVKNTCGAVNIRIFAYEYNQDQIGILFNCGNGASGTSYTFEQASEVNLYALGVTLGVISLK